jgi:RNA polymerase sigma-70 factor (ECF subfamily)
MTETQQFETFMRNYQDMVFSTAVRLLANPTEAEDIAQTVFLKAYEHFTSLSQSNTAGGWLKTVTTNLCLNHLSRYRSRWRLFSDMRSDSEDDTEYLDSVAAPGSMDQDLAEADYRQLLERAIEKLPAAQRVPLVLFHFEDMGYDDISRRLNVSLSKVKTDIHRARLALKRHLKPGLSGEDRWQENPGAGSRPAGRGIQPPPADPGEAADHATTLPPCPARLAGPTGSTVCYAN